MVVPTRSPERTTELLGVQVRVVEGSLESAGDAAALRDLLADISLTDVVASVGAWWSGPPVGRLDAATYDGVVGPVAVTSLVARTPVISRDRPDGRKGWLTAAQIGEVGTQYPASSAVGRHNQCPTYAVHDCWAEDGLSTDK